MLNIFKKKPKIMKTLYLVRHAKSDWSIPVDTDFERPLNTRGMRDAPFMAKNFADNYQVKPEIIISSPAIRALTTAFFFASELNYKKEDIVQDEDIYGNGKGTILKLISELKDENCAILFGHNPDISMVVTYLTGEKSSGLSTCSIAHIEFETNNWKDIIKQNGRLVSLNFPKKYFNDITDD